MVISFSCSTFMNVATSSSISGGLNLCSLIGRICPSIRNINGRATVRYRSEASVSTIILKNSWTSIGGYASAEGFKESLDATSDGSTDGRRAKQIGIHALRLRLFLCHNAFGNQILQ